MFIPNNDIKIVCKLEKDDRSIVNVSGISNRVTQYNKVKVTAIVSNVSLDVDISIFNPAAYYIGQDTYNHSTLTLYYANQNSPSSVDYKKYPLGLYPLGNTFLSLHNGVFHSNFGQSNNIIIDPKNILTVDGKLLDTTQYTGTKKLQFATGREVSSEIHAIDLYDYDNGNNGNKVGTLPTTFLAFDQRDNQINLFSWKKNFILSASQISKNNGYFTIKYETDGIVGYIKPLSKLTNERKLM